jgi:choline dehydrogenase-like flavoprotein
MAVAVVGSGISGIFAAHALASRELSVTILDVGETLDASRQEVVDTLHGLLPEQWPAADYELIRENPTFGKGALPKKVHFGSDYIYADNRSFAPTKTLAEGRVPYPTFAKGGFSNIWGAAILPPADCDMADWPVSHAHMEPYFRKVAELLPLCGGEGTLSDAFPAYRDNLGELDAGPQGWALLEDLRRVEASLRERQLLYGRARLAVHTQAASGGVLPCIGCGHCFTGCVRGSIFSTLPMLAEMLHSKRVEYRGGIFVDRIDETGGQPTLDVVDTKTNERRSLRFDAIFLAAGPINTTRLLLRSRRLYDRAVILKESQKFIVPMLRLRAAPTAMEHPSVTLASTFIEAKLISQPAHWIHLQIVPMHRMIVEAAGLIGALHPVGKNVWRPMLRRMMAAFCGMHSDYSSHLELRLRRGERGGDDILELDLKPSEQARAGARQAAKDLFRLGLAFRTLFCYWKLKFSNPGSGTHCGASFPMRRQPSDVLDTDVYGRPFGWSRVFAVDSSVLPSIPGTTLGFSVMANAYRIAREAPI